MRTEQHACLKTNKQDLTSCTLKRESVCCSEPIGGGHESTMNLWGVHMEYNLLKNVKSALALTDGCAKVEDMDRG